LRNATSSFFFLVGQGHIEALIVKVHQLKQVGSGAIVKIRRAGREAAQYWTLYAIEIGAVPGDERAPWIGCVKRFGLACIEGVGAARDENMGKSGMLNWLTAAATSGSGS
jgi:hypothetical protein